MSRLERRGDVVWELPAATREDMRVPARVFGDEDIVAEIERGQSLEQLANVATLPGIVDAAIAMPDMHQGYGFPVGAVAAFDPGAGGVVSPGGVGYDINCGVRLLALDAALPPERVEPFVHELSRSVPVGTGRGSGLALTGATLDRVLAEGCPYVVSELGAGVPDDLAVIESGGRLPGADPAKVSTRARERGRDQLGSLGSGNHFLEVQRIDTVEDEPAASVYGLRRGETVVLVHSGSRGVGHQICTDYVRLMDRHLVEWGLRLPDRQLSCAPLDTPQACDYLAAMAAAANFAWSNRQVMTHTIRTVARRLGAGDLRVVYDVAHNIVKWEEYGGRSLAVHRKGATRAFGPASADIPDRYRRVGQPVFVPGSMGTSSWVLAGNDASAERSFGSTCHGAGRALSRGEAKRRVQGAELRRELEARGITVRCPSNAGLAEEAPIAYKDADRVVRAVEDAGIARRVARLVPLGVLKG
jgi:tRNA-splicing ligase RtcB (3'-phosphate/5'-hydroxy nucleic acid ligase)